jgi:putative hemolysin
VVRTANRMIGYCFIGGGAANVDDHGSGMTYSCVYPDGTESSYYLPYD